MDPPASVLLLTAMLTNRLFNPFQRPRPVSDSALGGVIALSAGGKASGEGQTEERGREREREREGERGVAESQADI